MFTNPIAHWSGAAAPVPLYNFNPGEIQPVNQPFPANNAAMVALGLPAADGIWLFDDAGNFLDRVGAVDLVGNAFMRKQQLGIGLAVGSNLDAKLTAEMTDSSGALANATLNTSFDFGGNDSFCFFAVYRSMRCPGDYRSLVRKQDTAITAGYMFAGDGVANPEFLINDGLGGAAVARPPAGMCGGAWCYGMSYVHRAAVQEMGLFTNIVDDVGIDCSGVGALSNALFFGIGNHGSFPNLGGSIAYLAIWVTNAIDVITNWNAGSFYRYLLWQHGNDPTGLLTTQTVGGNFHQSSVCGTRANGLMVADWQYDDSGVNRIQFPIAYDAGFTHASQRGVQVTVAQISLVNESDDFTDAANWVPTGMNVPGGATTADAPNGYFGAVGIESQAVGPGAPSYLQHTIACLASTDYTFDVFVLRNSTEVADVSGSIEAYDLTGAATIASQAFTATTLWQRITLTFRTPVGCVSMGFRINVENLASHRVNVWRATARQGLLGPPIWAQGGAYGTRVSETVYRATCIAGDYMKGPQGEIVVHYKCFNDNDTVDRFLMATSAGSDRRRLRVTTTETDEMRYYNNVGGLVGTDTTGIVNQSLEHVVRFKWDVNAALPSGRFTEIWIDGVLTLGAVAGWAAGAGPTEIVNGMAQVGISQLQGIIDYIKIYEYPQLP